MTTSWPVRVGAMSVILPRPRLRDYQVAVLPTFLPYLLTFGSVAANQFRVETKKCDVGHSENMSILRF